MTDHRFNIGDEVRVVRDVYYAIRVGDVGEVIARSTHDDNPEAGDLLYVRFRNHPGDRDTKLTSFPGVTQVGSQDGTGYNFIEDWLEHT